MISTKSYDTIKLGIDAHAMWHYVARAGITFGRAPAMPWILGGRRRNAVAILRPKERGIFEITNIPFIRAWGLRPGLPRSPAHLSIRSHAGKRVSGGVGIQRVANTPSFGNYFRPSVSTEETGVEMLSRIPKCSRGGIVDPRMAIVGGPLQYSTSRNRDYHGPGSPQLQGFLNKSNFRNFSGGPGRLSNRKDLTTMSPTMGTMLMNDVVPRLKAAARSVPKVGADDNEEIVADMTVQAARMMVSADKDGRKFGPGNIAYFASRAARSGRRAGYSGRQDVMCRAA